MTGRVLCLWSCSMNTEQGCQDGTLVSRPIYKPTSSQNTHAFQTNTEDVQIDDFHWSTYVFR